MLFSKTLTNWYLQNKRDLPWRQTKDPYKIWLSEIILQQTRIDQGITYYLSFVKHFPTVFDLAAAKQETVLKLWQGLGYYSRARNLHASAQYIVNELNGQFPKDYKTLLALKGVGDYTASAIASICYNEPTAVVDGNVYRVLARFFGIFTPINASQGIKLFKKQAQQYLDVSNPGTHNQAIMEYGARVCKPQNPLCTDCDLQYTCVAFKENLQQDLPVKINKTKVRKRYFNFIISTILEENTILTQRKGKGIWQNLYEFPLIETTAILTKKQLEKENDFVKLFPKKYSLNLYNKKPIIHKLSHQHLYTQFWVLKTNTTTAKTISWNKVETFAVPVLIANFLQSYKRDLNF